MDQILVRGGKPLGGTVKVSGSKNAALPILCAALLNEQPVTLRNVPALHDVAVISDVLRSLGARVERNADGSLLVDSGGLNATAAPYELVNKMRASFLVLGPLLARYGVADVPLPGGCEIGARPVGEHLAAMRALGADMSMDAGLIKARARKLTGADMYLNVASVGATENAVMAATLAEGVTTIRNAAMEPEVTDLCHFLMRCGVRIGGAGTKVITVHGQPRISAAVDYSVIPDRIEAGTYLLALVGTGGEGTVHGARPDHLDALVIKLREMGVAIDHGEDWISVSPSRRLKSVVINTDVYPGFPTDLQPQMTAVLTAARGSSTVSETIFENRLTHVPELVRMGARIQLMGHIAVIEGPAESDDLTQAGSCFGCGLSGAPVEAHDLRCAAALVIAGLMARGETRVDGLRHLLRGYEQLPEKITSLGGEVSFASSTPEPPLDILDRPSVA